MELKTPLYDCHVAGEKSYPSLGIFSLCSTPPV